MESASTLQNELEVINSGFVKIEESEEKDASTTASDPNQDNGPTARGVYAPAIARAAPAAPFHHRQEHRQEYRQESHYPDRNATSASNHPDYLHTRDCHEDYHDRVRKVKEDYYNHHPCHNYHNWYPQQRQQQHFPRGCPESYHRQHQEYYSST